MIKYGAPKGDFKAFAERFSPSAGLVATWLICRPSPQLRADRRS